MDLHGFTAASLGGVCPGVSVVFRLPLGGVLVTSWCLENVESLGGVSVMPRWCLKMIMTKYAGNNLLDLVGKNRLQVLSEIAGVCPAGVLVVSQLCFGGRWCLGGTLVVCPKCLDGVR